MKMILRVIQFFWVLPLTVIVWLLYILPLWLLARDYRFVRVLEPGIIMLELVNIDVSAWHTRLWRDWGGVGLPCAVLLRARYATDPKLIRHELEHCYQLFRWGIFQPIIYVFTSLFIYFFVPSKHPYYDNPFERQARRVAGQVVDIPRSKWGSSRWIWW